MDNTSPKASRIMKIASTGASPRGGQLPAAELRMDTLSVSSLEAGDGEELLLQQEGSKTDEFHKSFRAFFSRQSRLTQILACVGLVVFSGIALAAASATAPTLVMPDAPPSRGTTASGHGSRRHVLRSLDTVCFFPPCSASQDGSLPTWASAEVKSIPSTTAQAVPPFTSWDLPSALVNIATTTTTEREIPPRPLGTWKVVGHLMSCSENLYKMLADHTTVAQCMAMTLAEPACSNQMYSDGSLCRCVLARQTCDFKHSLSGNVYERQLPGTARSV
jgi:hypothetical protein